MIPGDTLRVRRENLGMTQSEAARLSGLDQRDLSRIELELVKGGEIKPRYIAFLHRMEALQPKNDSDMTTESQLLQKQESRRAAYDLRLYQPTLAGQGGIMSFGVQAAAMTRRPHFLDGIEEAYAFVMIGQYMEPMFWSGWTLYVNPALAIEDGKPHIFFDPEGKSGQVAMLCAVSDDNWHIKKFNPPEVTVLARADWPACFRIEGAHIR